MLLAIGTNINELAALKAKLNDSFDMKDLGDASHILGMCIEWDRDKKLLYLSQPVYIEKVIKHFNMERGKTLSAQLPPCVKLCVNDCPKYDAKEVEMAKVPY